MPFFEQIYHKQLEKGKKIIEKRNENLEPPNEIIEPTLYFKKQKIRKADPCYDKVNITSVRKSKIKGVRAKTNATTNIHKRKVKRLRKTFPLQDEPPDDRPGPSHRKT